MKIHLVTLVAADEKPLQYFLVKAHTCAGAEKYVRSKTAPFIEARVPTQDDLVWALQSGIAIEDATAPAGSGTNDETQESTP